MFLRYKDITLRSPIARKMNEKTGGCSWNSNQPGYGGPPERTNIFLNEEDGVSTRIIFQSPQRERAHEVRASDHEQSPRRISVNDFSIPKFQMRLAAHQGNPKLLASLLEAKRTKKKRFLRPKLQEPSTSTSENATPEFLVTQWEH